MSVFFKFFIFFLFVFHNSLLFSQNQINDEVNTIKKSILDFDVKIKKTKALLEQENFSNNLENKSDAYHYLGFYYNRIRNYNQAIIETQKAILIRKNLVEKDYKYYNSLFNLSENYKALGDVSQQKTILLTIIGFHKKNKFTYYAYSSLSKIYNNAGDYFNGISCLEKVINANEDDGVTKGLLFMAYRTSIYNYSKMEKLDEAAIKKIEHYAQEVELLKRKDLKTLIFYNNLGKIYRNVGDNEKAIQYLKKALHISLAYEDYDAGIIFNNIGALYSEQAKYKLGNTYYLKALEATDNQVTEADVYNNQGFYLETNNSINKNGYYNKALSTVLALPNNSNAINFLPSIEQIRDSPFKIDIIGYLINKANNFLFAYNEENNKDYLEYAKETLYLIDELVSYIRHDSEVERSKLFWINKGVDVYMLAVKVCYLLNTPEEAFYFMEKNKYLLLLENIDQVKIETKSSVDTSRKESKILSLKAAKEKYVSKEANFIEFILNEKSGYGIFCENNNISFFKIENVPLLLNEIKTIKSQFSVPFSTNKEFETYNDTAFSIFSKIFPFEKALQKIANKKLVIISDYKLHNLPFSALTVKENSNSNLDYLLKYTETSYLHSTSVDAQINNEEFITNNKILGFAPTVFKKDSLPNLENSELEMKKYTSFLPLELKSRAQATKKELYKSVKENYSIIHINSHAGYTKSQEPWLSLYDDNISLEEIYNLDAKTELVILDACKSNRGKQEMGEGIMSLSRAFFYSGTQSVIASQWNVNEKSNNKILHTFYKNIKAGKTKSKALHDAKLEYLKNHQLDEVSPYFWASLTLTGSPEVIALASNISSKTIALITILVLGLLFLVLKKKNTSI